MTSRTSQQPSLPTFGEPTAARPRQGAPAPTAAPQAEVRPAPAPRSIVVVVRWRSATAIMRGWLPRPIEPTEPRQSRWRRFSRAMVDFFDGIAERQERARSRQALLSLDDRMLRDIGVDRATAHYVGELPFWHRNKRPF